LRVIDTPKCDLHGPTVRSRHRTTVSPSQRL